MIYDIFCSITSHQKLRTKNALSTTLCVKHSSNKLNAGSKDVSLHMHGLPTIEFNLMVAAMTSLQFPQPDPSEVRKCRPLSEVRNMPDHHSLKRKGILLKYDSIGIFHNWVSDPKLDKNLSDKYQINIVCYNEKL